VCVGTQNDQFASCHDSLRVWTGLACSVGAASPRILHSPTAVPATAPVCAPAAQVKPSLSKKGAKPLEFKDLLSAQGEKMMGELLDAYASGRLKVGLARRSSRGCRVSSLCAVQSLQVVPSLLKEVQFTNVRTSASFTKGRAKTQHASLFCPVVRPAMCPPAANGFSGAGGARACSRSTLEGTVMRAEARGACGVDASQLTSICTTVLPPPWAHRVVSHTIEKLKSCTGEPEVVRQFAHKTCLHSFFRLGGRALCLGRAGAVGCTVRE
jgi:hypothetical protein